MTSSLLDASGTIVDVGRFGAIRVLPGRRLLSGVSDDPSAGAGDGPAGGYGPSLAAHQARWVSVPRLRTEDLCAAAHAVDVRGRGGAGFPFARKLQTAADSRGRAIVVVNASEGEPASAKDSALIAVAPHLVLDGARIVAHALGAREIHVVVPGERPGVAAAMHRALAERARHGDDRVTPVVTPAWPRFVAGQAQAVIQLLSGRDNLPVTAWVPEPMSGLRGRPTMLSNAETFAHIAVLARLGAVEYARLGLPLEPGTTLVTVAGDTVWSPGQPGGPLVAEVAYGARMAPLLEAAGYDPSAPVLVGGYHGGWLPAGAATTATVSRTALADLGAPLGAGVLSPLPHGMCPVRRTSTIVDYLARESAQRCGPCINGLPVLAATLQSLADCGPGRTKAVARAAQVAGLVTGRGACAHPDGTARLVRSLLTTFPHDVAAHAGGRCLVDRGEVAR